MSATIPRYQLDRPTAAELERALAGIVGPQDADIAIAHALRELDAPRRSTEELSPGQLLDLALALTRQRGLTSIIARSFVIRLRSYLELDTPDSGTQAPS